MPAEAQKYKAPEWDRQAVAAPYLIALRQELASGQVSPDWLDALYRGLARELRTVYERQDLDVALQGLDRLISLHDQAERNRRDTEQPGLGKHPEIAKRWQRISRGETAQSAPDRTLPPPLARRRKRRRSIWIDAYREITDWLAVGIELAHEGAKRALRWLAESRRPTPPLSRTVLKGEPVVNSQTASRPTTETSNGTATNATEAKRVIDGAALHRSIIPTWLGLVAMSWVSLVWGMLISLPFGVGIGIAVSFVGGVIAVPLWGTILGFLGMSAARSSTLRSMQFTEVAADHPLAVITDAYAKTLGLPTPKVGTVNVHNAFAMGLSRSDATIAIGIPLMDDLTPDEVAAIIGHELGHVANGDMRRMMLMRTFQNATVWFMFSQRFKQFARWIICWASELAILKSSRTREYWADAIGAALAGKEATISVMRKMEGAPALTAEENTHARFMVRGRFTGLFSTHPSFAERIGALERETYLARLPWKA